jgi:hypothetical protein
MAKDLKPSCNAYVKMDLQTQVLKAAGVTTNHTHEQGAPVWGGRPNFHQNFSFLAVPPDAVCEFEVWDSCKGGDHLLGRFSVPMLSMMLGVTSHKYVELRPAPEAPYGGELLVKLTYDVTEHDTEKEEMDICP